jgi:hypothetical protein
VLSVWAETEKSSISAGTSTSVTVKSAIQRRAKRIIPNFNDLLTVYSLFSNAAPIKKPQEGV